MIEIIFYFGTEIVLVRVNGNRVSFMNGNVESTIEGLRLSKLGVLKEFPDLKDNLNWKEEAIKRFKKKLYDFKTEEEVVQYVIDDLKKYGYIPKWKQKRGFRREVI